MSIFKSILIYCVLFLIPSSMMSQTEFDDEQLGAWYMYFWSTNIKDSEWGAQGDLQYRNWDIIGDLEQLLLRGGLTYQPKNTPIKFTLGYANITTGTFGDSDNTFSESRIYQEALLPQKISDRFLLTHRFRYEQRFVDDQDFRTRFRYNIFLNILLNKTSMEAKTVYLALYNELFINGERDTGGDNRRVEAFDRNRFYAALGYALKKQLRFQLGLMRQTTASWKKNQLQLSCHHTF